jgi:hypothetical protein
MLIGHFHMDAKFNDFDTTLMNNWEFYQVSILEFKGQEILKKILDNNIKVLKSTQV